MKANSLSLTILAALALAVGCHRETAENGRVEQNKSVKIYTEDELNKSIISGISTEEVTNRFGPPDSTIEISQNTSLLTYSFPRKLEEEEALHLSGFTIRIKDGKVAKWSPIMEESRKSFQAGESQRPYGEQSFQIFLAIDELTNVANTVASQGIADAGSLNVPPHMAFKAKVFTGKDGNESPRGQTVILVLADQDASKLKDFTEANLGKRLLIVYRNKVIAAPTISAILASRQLEFTVKDSGALENLRKQ